MPTYTRLGDQIIPGHDLPVAPLSEHVVLRTLLLAANSGMEFDIHTQTNPRLSKRCRIALLSDLVADTAQQMLDMFGTQSRNAPCRMAAVRYRAQARAAAARAGN
jgi:hypothetical protein